MIRYQITGSNPIEMNTAAKLLLDHPRVNVSEDSGNRNGRKDGYIRYIHATFSRDRRTKFKPKKSLLDGAAKMSLANQCWQNIVQKTDNDDDAVSAIVKLIEYVERECL